MQVKVVWACIEISKACQDTFLKNSARREKKGQRKKRWENNISEWTGLKFCNTLREAENKLEWRERVARSVLPNGHRDYGIGARCKLQNYIKNFLF